MRISLRLTMLCLLFTLLLAACSQPSGEQAASTEQTTPAGSSQLVSLTTALPAVDAVQGWKPSGEAQLYDDQNLYDLVNGQADAFFAYNFERVAVQNYEKDGGQGLRLEIWQLATPADAYGLFTTFRAGTPVAVGNDGDADPGRRLDFWQERYLVRLFAPQALPDADLETFARAVAGSLPGGGERPALLERLPQGIASPMESAPPGDAIFFRREISIQDYLWLGGQNILGLGPETDGVLARYGASQEGGGGATATLLLVHYPDVRAAQAAAEALQAGQIDTLVLARAQGDLLGAVFGMVSEEEAHTLLDSALADE